MFTFAIWPVLVIVFLDASPNVDNKWFSKDFKSVRKTCRIYSALGLTGVWPYLVFWNILVEILQKQCAWSLKPNSNIFSKTKGRPSFSTTKKAKIRDFDTMLCLRTIWSLGSKPSNQSKPTNVLPSHCHLKATASAHTSKSPYKVAIASRAPNTKRQESSAYIKVSVENTLDRCLKTSKEQFGRHRFFETSCKAA